MTDPIEPTAAPIEPVNEPTAAPSAGEKKLLEFTQEELDKKFADRQKRGEEAAAKRFQKQIDELTAKVTDYEGKDLGELEKLQKKLEKLNGVVVEKETALTGANLKITKMEALLNAGALPEQVTKLLKRVAGTTPEEIESDVLELKELGWIGQKLPEPEPKPRGIGTATKTGDPPQKKALRDQLNEVNLKLKDPKISYNEKSKLIDLALKLNRRIQKGET
jgi:hypothetical protein